MQEQHKKQPEISIIVPVYKTERFLSACISSILAQTFTDFELILVDDGSPDSCPAVCDSAAAKDSRIRVIHQKNRGLSGARNAGLDAAEGEWIAFVDSDDTITPDFCAKLYHAAQEAGAQMAVCNYRQVDEALTPIREQYLHVRREVLTPEQALEHSTLLPYMVVWNKLYQPQAGTVTIGGVDVARITDRERRTCIGCVEQHFSRVPGTVLEQITLGDPQITAEMAWNAAKLAGIDEAIQALPEGCDTVCSDGMFSQGEWQLLSIARAAAADPAVLLLDEVTANLDAETEARVLEALRRASAGRTVLSVSHRIYENLGGRTVKIEPQSM